MKIYEWELKNGISRTKEFERKGLATHAVNCGLKCGHGCKYCSTGAMLRTHKAFKELGLSPFDNDYAIVDPKTPRRVARDARIKQRRGLIQLCTIVDAWLPEAQQYDIGRKCLEAILAEPSWTVRILTKNAAIQKDFDLIGKYKNRVLVIYTDDECNRMVRAASQVQNDLILEWDLMITLALVTALRKSELLSLTWRDIDFEEYTLLVSPKQDADETWEWKIKDTDCRILPLTEDTVHLLVNLQNRRPEGYPYVFIPPVRYDHIQENLIKTDSWILCHTRTSIVHNFDTQFKKIIAKARVKERYFS